MRITKRQLRRIIKEEKAKLQEMDPAARGADTHHYPRVEWSNVEELVDKWSEAEYAAFDTGDPSMMAMGDTVRDARMAWNEQIKSAAMDMENEMTQRIRGIALQVMKEYTDKLINGDYA
jgi:replicative DNA helicase